MGESSALETSHAKISAYVPASFFMQFAHSCEDEREILQSHGEKPSIYYSHEI